jgi:hypothetical protein
MDILSNGWEIYQGFAYDLPTSIYSFLIRANAILLIPTAIAYAGFIKGWRNSAAQSFLIVLGMLIGLSLPIDSYLLYNDHWRPWVIPLLVTGLFYLPSALAFLRDPRLGEQLKLRKRIQIGLIALFIINLFWG